uniref:PDZ domain-containing protein n=1 Tax=Physcomitrium patens TaxID=3218 RepID=A0A7I4FVI0_PHYPA
MKSTSTFGSMAIIQSLLAERARPVFSEASASFSLDCLRAPRQWTQSVSFFTRGNYLQGRHMAKRMVISLRRNSLLNYVWFGDTSMIKFAPHVMRSYAISKQCSRDCDEPLIHCLALNLRSIFSLPRGHGVAQDEESQECGGHGLLRYAIFTFVGLMGGLSMLFSLVHEPALALSTHEFVDMNLESNDVTLDRDSEAQTMESSSVFLGCPARGRAAPLSLLLRYPRNFKDHSSFQFLTPDIVREWAGESSGASYGQIVAAREDKTSKKDMYTRDAWMGMRRLEQYGRLVESMEDKEKLCVDCVRNRRLLEQVWQTVSNDYYDHYGSFSQSQWAGELYRTLSKAGGLLETKAETYAAVKEMVSHLGDKYSSFLVPNEYRLAIHRPLQSEIKYLSYQYTGIGMELGGRSLDGSFTIVAPFAGSPAEEAGILGGEKLVAVDNMRMESVSRDEAVALLRGPIGSMVELSIAGEDPKVEPRTLLIERRTLPLPPLQSRMLDAGNGRLVAYMRLHYFTHEGTKKMASAIREGEALGVDGYILDLRNNPGGVFEEAVAMALWLDCKGCNVTETVRSNEADIEDLVYTVGNLPKDVFLKHPGALTHAPLTVITNRDSASASEVLTGALHDNHRVMTVGERTFGKGVVQYYFPMDDGSGLKLTVAKYLTPDHYDISKRGGIEPDKACHDYPHGKDSLDTCIEEALKMLVVKEAPDHASYPSPMPYRWLPLSKSWAKGSY